MANLAIVLSTFATSEAAASVARILVDEHLCACVNLITSIRSIYRWQGTIADEAEVLAIVKTTPDRRAALIARLTELHPYDVPEVVALDGEAAASYLAWVTNETG